MGAVGRRDQPLQTLLRSLGWSNDPEECAGDGTVAQFSDAWLPRPMATVIEMNPLECTYETGEGRKGCCTPWPFRATLSPRNFPCTGLLRSHQAFILTQAITTASLRRRYCHLGPPCARPADENLAGGT